MRNVILLHARQDAGLAEEFAARNHRIALACAVDRTTSMGRFGPQFHLAVLWTRRAALDGLEWRMADTLTDRELPGFVLVLDGIPVPGCLNQIATRANVTAMTDLDAVFRVEASRPLIDMDAELADAARASARRRTAAVATTAALSISCGALLAHAASPHGLIPISAEPTFTPTARVAHAPNPVLSSEESLPAIEAVVVRADQVRASAVAVAESPMIRARFERVKSLAISDMLLAQMATRAEAQAESLFRAAPKVQTLSAVDVSGPAQVLATTDDIGVKFALADFGPGLRSTF